MASWLSHGQLFANSREAEAVAAANGELTMVAKRSRFPGTPSIALAPGKGVLAVSEVLVTWVSLSGIQLLQQLASSMLVPTLFCPELENAVLTRHLRMC